jgi:uncharacterized membrane protein YwaF
LFNQLINSSYFIESEGSLLYSNDPVLIQKNKVYSLPSYLLHTRINGKGMFPSDLPTKTMKALLFFIMHAIFPAHLILLYLIILMAPGQQPGFVKLLTM